MLLYYTTCIIIECYILYLHVFEFSATVLCGAAQTDNTAAVVGGVTVAVATIVVVALLRLLCGLPARTPVQYVHIV